MRAARQGAFDGLCGVYALINCLDEVGLKRPRSKLHKDLFIALTHALPSDRLKAAMDDGLCTEDLIGAARRGFRAIRRQYFIDLRVGQPFAQRAFGSVDEFAASLTTFVQASSASVIINMGTPHYDHWTVVRGLEGRRLLVRDSGALKQLDLGRFTVDRGRYRLRPAETLLVQLRAAKPQ